ncbi:hypothetical protein Q9L58_008832 [Maublancomyces gigas]|uniref:RNase H type-1 domain-containing protein n=1 Tax=Discina gigas TaxID=1032678 RepID=A0ABR3G915_9PEZI
MAVKIRRLWREARRRGIEVKLEWVKGHAKIWGNVKADKRSKEGAGSRGREDDDAFISEAWMTREAKEEVVREWSTKWKKEKKVQGKDYGLTPETRHTASQHPASRREKVVVSRLRSGHINVNKYRKRIGKIESEECQCYMSY